jgi:uncharacterized membrane protein
MQAALDIVTILSVGLMIGTEFAVSAFVNPILGQLDGRAEADATRLFARRLGRAMPFWYILGFVLMVVEASIRRHEAGAAWIVTALFIFAFVILMTLLFLVPINNKIAQAQEQVFSDSLKRQHATWDLLHRGRVLLLVVAMALFLVGIRA